MRLDSIKNKKILKYIPSPSYDYDISLRQKKIKKKIINKNYAVFIDSMIMHHDDYRMNYKYHNVPVTLKYFEEMNNFFAKLEKKFNLEVIIALHPNCFIKIILNILISEDASNLILLDWSETQNLYYHMHLVLL